MKAYLHVLGRDSAYLEEYHWKPLWAEASCDRRRKRIKNKVLRRMLSADVDRTNRKKGEAIAPATTG